MLTKPKKDIKDQMAQRRKEMQESVNAFKSEFYADFGFDPVVIYEDLDDIKIRALRKPSVISLDQVLEVCNSFVDYSRFPKGVATRARLHELVVVRHIYFYIGYKFNFTLNSIAGKIGYDHSSVIHGVKVISDMIDVNDKMYVKIYWEVCDELKERTGNEYIF